jgi:NitT/TauT family transport system ATP-binding protein
MTSSYRFELKERLITIENVSVSYGGKTILKNVNATINDIIRPDMSQGQIVALLGPSGIGKSTLFKVLSGLITPDTGRVFVGKEQKPVRAGDVGVVAQNYPLLNHRSVYNNLAFAGARAGKSDADIKTQVFKYLVEFDLFDHKDKFPTQLSGGQRQRVAIAQQLMCSEHYLIMDEPFSGLDVVALAKVRTLLLAAANINEENTFIVVTHDVTSAVSIADTIWLMGRDRDAQGNVIPGARIMDTINLIDMDICWHNDPTMTVQAPNLIHDIKARFLTL